MRCPAPVWIPCLVLLLLPVLPFPGSSVEAAEDVSLANAGFAEWSKGLPAGWSRSVGARRDPGTTATRIAPVQGGGVALEGDAGTNLWHILGQTVKAAPGDYLELALTARAVGLKHERGQYGSCYVGFVFRSGGTIRGLAVQSVRQEAWRAEHVRVRVPKDVDRVDVGIFLSMTGRIEVRKVGVRRLAPEDAYDVLVAEMDRHYSFFAAHDLDWKQISTQRAHLARKAKTPAAFIEAIQPMLALLADGHVWIQTPEGKRLETLVLRPRPTRNFELGVVMNHLENVQQVVRNVIMARTPEGYGYIALGTMQLNPEDYAFVERSFRAMFNTKGIILDLRVNAGGAERVGQALCSFLTKKRLLYGRQQVRGGPAHDDLMPGGDRYVVPAPSGHYEGPVVALVGPGCVSSGEGMAMMLKAIPGIPLVGLPTRGSSGNPQPAHLPNGVSVWFSRWISLLPDGTPIERKGVPPDLRVQHVPGKDPALRKAIEILKAKAGKR